MSFTPWLAAFGKGFATMAALIVAIGIQNAFVLRQGVRRQAVFVTASICFVCDVVLVSIGTAGLGVMFAESMVLSILIAFGGAAFLTVYGVRALQAARHAKGLDVAHAAKATRKTAAAAALAVSLLNPHAILDTVVLVGGLAARYPEPERAACAIGGMTASGVWFYMLAYGARFLAPVLTKPKIWRFIDAAIGITMICLAFGLAHDGWDLVAKLK